MRASEDHLVWLVSNRSRNQAATLELYDLIRRFENRLDYELAFQKVAQELAAVAFSLWRAVFLSDLPGEARRMLHVETFLRKLIADNAVVYQTDKDSREWTFRYYADNARYRLADISDRLMPEVVPSALLRSDANSKSREDAGSERREWETLQAALEAPIRNFGETLASAPTREDTPP